jgi:hypothetical protein
MIEMTYTWGSQHAASTSATAGTVSADGMSVTNINGTTVTISTTADTEDAIQIGTWKIYYTTAPAGPATYKVSLKDGVMDANKWTIKSGETTVTPGVTEVAEGAPVTATYGGQRHVKSVKAVVKAGVFAAKTLAEATAEDIGKIAGADGKIYATKADAEAVATGNAVAMIAYIGTASDCTHGLAIALADESGEKNYEAAGTACSSKAAVTGGTWRLPSIKDWQYIFIGCGASGSYSVNPTSMSYSGLASKLTTAQGDALQSGNYWSSTEKPGDLAWYVYFDGSTANFSDEDESNEYQVRACLAF